ncbi:MAG TPA: PQQ-dependent sugar dehydrogenase [Longimicrobium sp.]|nr:PQQ-dependent sugar dehydrogenase [Longimicrobium sp.]
MTRSAVPFALAALLAACGGDREAAQSPDARATTAGDAASKPSAQVPAATAPRCDAGNGGITLPRGFCATVFADVDGSPRHIAVAPNGDVYVALTQRQSGGTAGVLALRDTNGDGKADQQERFGPANGGSGIAISDGWLYFAQDSAVHRWRLDPGRLVPAGQPQTIVSGLPTGGHTAKTIALDGSGALFVNIGSRTNACQQQDRQRGSRGVDPCTELQTRAGIWRFDAARPGQTQAQGERYATGIRNAVGMTVSGSQLYATQHGRDQLGDNWPDLYNDQQNAENPGEELLLVNRGDDFGWPYCFYHVGQQKLVLAPEYGGRGSDVGRCAQKKGPVTVFPGHWAPESVVIYQGTQFPVRYQGGAFIAFHGSWNRAPLPQAGFNVSFVPLSGGRATAKGETFADGFRGAGGSEAGHRPMGLAVAPDGSLYITDDAGGRIWRVFWRG